AGSARSSATTWSTCSVTTRPARSPRSCARTSRSGRRTTTVSTRAARRTTRATCPTRSSTASPSSAPPRSAPTRCAGSRRPAAQQGAQIICLPELATNVYFPFEIEAKWLKLAEPIGGPSVETMRSAARAANAYVLFPFYEKEQDGELYNTAVFISPNGELLGK